MVQFKELFAMRRNKRNEQPDEGVCDIQHMVHSDEQFVIRQHKKKVREQGRGTGLGLAIVHHVANAHGGRVLLWSRPGRGFRVELELPVAGPASTELGDGDEAGDA
jgi:signal transduction histidine kinase